MSTSDPAAAEDPVARLERADRERERAREAVESVGEADLRALREACEQLREVLTRYEDRATGDGDFAAFIEFQDRIGTFTQELDDDLPAREVFEDVDDRLQQRRLSESDFAAVRDRLADAEDRLDTLDEWEQARERYREARRGVREHREELAERIDDLERLVRLGEADLSAPVEELRDPVAAYDEAVAEAFDAFTHEAPARAVLDLVAQTRWYPLVPFREPPPDLKAFVDDSEAGTEPIPQLLEYADYSRSKLDHYVADPDALKRAVATQQTYLRRLDAGPLQVGWPPPEAGVLRYQCEEHIAVVGRFAEDVVPKLRAVRECTRRADYERLRRSAVALDELTDEERERLRTGAVAERLAEARAARERADEALERHPPLSDL